MADILLSRPALASPDSVLDQQAEMQPVEVKAIALLTSSLLGHLPGDEGEEVDEQSGDEHGPEKLQARKPHLAGRFSGTFKRLFACCSTAVRRSGS